MDRLVGIPVVLSDRLSSQRHRHSSGRNSLAAKVSGCECILCLRILSPCPQEKLLRSLLLIFHKNHEKYIKKVLSRGLLNKPISYMLSQKVFTKTKEND